MKLTYEETITIIVKNIKTNLSKELVVSNFSDLQLNEILYFYNNLTKGYHAYIKE